MAVGTKMVFKHVEGFELKEDENQYSMNICRCEIIIIGYEINILKLEMIIPFANHPIVRYLLGWALPPRVNFEADSN